MVLLQRISENYTFPRIQRGSNIFQEVNNSFSRVGGGGGDPNANFYRNPYNLWFSGGGGGSGPHIPLWIRTWIATAVPSNIRSWMFGEIIYIIRTSVTLDYYSAGVAAREKESMIGKKEK